MMGGNIRCRVYIMNGDDRWWDSLKGQELYS